ncbi:MAG: hypothetical protein HYV03_01775 [Deltaproteobacteria bacterium]|nr:hypothetical protein [Deltaproteobacteria bacterium]
MEPLRYQYQFRSADGASKQFVVILDPETLAYIPMTKPPYPEWTKLAHSSCPNCPLNRRRHAHCPAAVSAIDLVEAFKGAVSYEEAEVIVTAPEREYRKRTSLQKGLAGLLGLCMVTSGCPVLAWLRPMARFHLPFASIEETEYRTVTMYLLGQYFRWKKGARPRWDLKGLVEQYQIISEVNRHFVKRLRAAVREDAGLNALIHLDNFAQAIPFAINKKALAQLRQLFRPWLTDCGEFK